MVTVTGYKDGAPVLVHLALIDGHGHYMEQNAAFAFARMASAARRAGYELIVNEGFRTFKEQQRLFDEWKAGKRKLRPSNPGFSKHGYGIAVDISMKDDNGTPRPYADWLKKNAHEFGFVFPIEQEPWHAEYVGNGV